MRFLTILFLLFFGGQISAAPIFEDGHPIFEDGHLRLIGYDDFAGLGERKRRKLILREFGQHGAWEQALVVDVANQWSTIKNVSFGKSGDCVCINFDPLGAILISKERGRWRVIRDGATFFGPFGAKNITFSPDGKTMAAVLFSNRVVLCNREDDFWYLGQGLPFIASPTKLRYCSFIGNDRFTIWGVVPDSRGGTKRFAEIWECNGDDWVKFAEVF